MAENETDAVLTFEVYRGSSLIKRADFHESSITIGSGVSALLQVEDDQVAELHAVINIEEDGSVSLLDLGSDNGVTVGGEKVANATLHTGDSFQIGELTINVIAEPANMADEGFDDQDATYVAPSMAALRQIVDAEASGNAEGVLVDGEGDAEDEEDDGPEITEEEEEEDTGYVTEDVMQFILRSGTAGTAVGVDKKRPMVLEVNQIWSETLLDTRHFTKRTMGHDVTVGSSVGYKWHFLGIDMGWIPSPLRIVLPLTPPMWSEVNSDWKNDFYAPDENLPGSNDHTLFVHDMANESYTAQVADTWDGFVDIEDQRYTFEDLVEAGKGTKSGNMFEIPMEPNVRLMIDIDGVVFFSHMVHPGARILSKTGDDLDYPFMAIASFMGFLGLMFGVVMYFSPKPAANEMTEIPDRFVELLLDKPEPEEKKEKKPDANPDAGEGAKAKKEEGKVGKKDAKMEKAKGNKVEVKKKELDRQVAENAGVLGALRDAGDLDGVFGTSNLDANLTGGVGGLIGAKGTQIGSGGLGARGSGLGGGGTAEGLGGLGTKGIGSGRSGYGAGGGSFGAKGEGGIGTVGGDPIILGALDRSLIDEVIKRHMNQIRYCYQRELTKNPALGGKVVIKFVIAKDGTVSSASVKTTTMNNGAVEQCIVGRFMRMQFPEPKGGGIVIVSYPFIFSPG